MTTPEHPGAANALAEVAQRQAQYQESSDPALCFVAQRMQLAVEILCIESVFGLHSRMRRPSATEAWYLGFQWLPGALVTEYVSTDGRTFRRPPAGWTIGTWKEPVAGDHEQSGVHHPLLFTFWLLDSPGDSVRQPD